MQYEIEAGGRPRHVTIRRAGDGFAISVDGRPHYVDFARIDAYALSLIVDRDVSAGAQEAPYTSRPGPFGSGLVYETTIAPEPGARRLVALVGTVPVTVRLTGRSGRRQAGTAAASGSSRVVAPMPGKVVRVLVRAGETVRARQAVVVVEAMKMENELRADRDGTVAEIHAREGMLVDAGALLIVIQ